MDVATEVFICPSCTHHQSPDLPELAAFYDSNYKISLNSDEHDQLYEMRGSTPIYRTDRQAEIVLETIDVKKGAAVLDYGAAKANTLRKLTQRRTDILPHVFDVSTDYRDHWLRWMPSESTATYEVPASWRGKFDLITSHYVFEHIPDPPGTLKLLSTLLAPGGRIFWSVPDWTKNVGDLLVADHISHFTKQSIETLVRGAGLEVEKIDTESLASAFVVICKAAGGAGATPAPAEAKNAMLDTVRRLSAACDQLDKDIAAHVGRRVAVFGAGFYGSFLLVRMSGKLAPACCVDNSPHLWGTTLFDVPVLAPKDLPADVEVVFVGLNPARAKAIAASVPALQRAGLRLVYIDT